MKRRARRVTLAAAVFGGGVLAVLVVLNWKTVCDHVQAWHFQLARKTETVLPDPLWRPQELPAFVTEPDDSTLRLPQYLANCSGRAVVFESWPRFIFERRDWSADQVVGILRAVPGYRVLEQYFPRRAYVVMRDEHAPRPFYGGAGAIGVPSQRSGCGGFTNEPMQEAAAAIYKEPWMRAISQPTPPEAPSHP